MNDDAKEFTKGQTDFQILVGICLALFAGTVAFSIAFAELHSEIFLVFTVALGLFTVITAILAINARKKMNKPQGYHPQPTQPYQPQGQTLQDQLLQDNSENKYTINNSPNAVIQDKQSQSGTIGSVQVKGARDVHINYGKTEKEQEEEVSPEEIYRGKLSIADARSIATNFVKNEKNPERINVSSVAPKGKGWIVKGSYPVKIENGSGSNNFIVELDKDGEVVSFDFSGGHFIAFSKRN